MKGREHKKRQWTRARQSKSAKIVEPTRKIHLAVLIVKSDFENSQFLRNE